MFSSLVIASLAVITQPREVQLNAETVSTNTPIVVETDASVAAEGYRLEIKAGGISIRSADAAGAFYARQTLEQMRDGANDPVCRRWWEYMAPLMDVHEDNSPVTCDLQTVFHLD